MPIKIFKVLLTPILALLFGLGASLVIAWMLGESPIHVILVLLNSSFGSLTDFGYSLYYATPLFLTGLSVAWAFRAGLFNIGAEGQMALGGLAMAAVGICLPGLSSAIAIPLAFMVAFMVGGAWGAIAGWMKSYRGCHEVLSTIMLNFIAYGLSSFFILNVFKNPASQVPETAEVGLGYQLASLTQIGGSSPLSTAIFLSLIALLVFAFVMGKTRFGLYQRLAGGGPELGRLAGVNMKRQVISAMFISGGLAALAAAGPVLGFAHKTREGFTSSMGFVGIAVALLGRNSALGIFFSALLFGVLSKGALDLDLDTRYVSRDLATVIQAFIVLAVASQPGVSRLVAELRSRRARSLERR